jgi:hypothetical protein
MCADARLRSDDLLAPWRPCGRCGRWSVMPGRPPVGVVGWSERGRRAAPSGRWQARRGSARRGRRRRRARRAGRGRSTRARPCGGRRGRALAWRARRSATPRGSRRPAAARRGRGRVAARGSPNAADPSGTQRAVRRATSTARSDGCALDALRVGRECAGAHPLGQRQQPRDIAGEYRGPALASQRAQRGRTCVGPAGRALLGERVVQRDRPRRTAGEPRRTRTCSRSPRLGRRLRAVAVRDPCLREATERTTSPPRPTDHLLAAPYDVPESQRRSFGELTFALRHATQHHGVELAGRHRRDLLNALLPVRWRLHQRLVARRSRLRARPSDKRRRRLKRLRRARGGRCPALRRLRPLITPRGLPGVRRRRRRPEGMRQKSTTMRKSEAGQDLRLHAGAATRLMRRHGPSTREPATRAWPRRRCARSDRGQRARASTLALASALAGPPRACTPLGDAQLLGRRRGRGEEHDLRAPPPATCVALGLMRDHAGGLEIVEPALHALAMRAHEPRPLRPPPRHRAPAHHRRQPHNQLLDRARVARRARRMPEPKQVALDRVRARLEPVIARRDAAAPATRTTEQRAHDQAPGLGRKRLARRPIPATTRNSATRRRGVLQRHRQRPNARAARNGQRRRADARGAAGRTRRGRAGAPSGARRPDPRNRG